jgi:phosphoribosylanthranilate isomerase
VKTAKLIKKFDNRMTTPYIGITGITSADEAIHAVKSFEANKKSHRQTGHQLMLGVLVSYKTLKIGAHPTKRRYPPLREIPEILEAVKGKCFPVLHYNTRTPEFVGELRRLLEFQDLYRKGLVRGVQLNINAPSPTQVAAVSQRYAKLSIILQFNQSPHNITNYPQLARDYGGSADYVLIDPSRGTGLAFAHSHAVTQYAQLRQCAPWGIGFAGGLSPENIKSKLSRLKSALETTDFSIDAESGLRDQGDDLDLKKVDLFLQEAQLLLAA